jgi:hypothetical protein
MLQGEIQSTNPTIKKKKMHLLWTFGYFQHSDLSYLPCPPMGTLSSSISLIERNKVLNWIPTEYNFTHLGFPHLSSNLVIILVYHVASSLEKKNTSNTSFVVENLPSTTTQILVIDIHPSKYNFNALSFEKP